MKTWIRANFQNKRALQLFFYVQLQSRIISSFKISIFCVTLSVK